MGLALENSGVELTTDYIKIKLLQEEYNPNPMAPYSSDNALVTKYKWRKSTEHSSEQKPKCVQNRYRANKECFICNKRGHQAATRIQTESFKRKGNERNDDATMTAMSAQIGAKGWYIDSGATKHMTCNKNCSGKAQKQFNSKLQTRPLVREGATK
jgi:hypothetical protein